MKAQQSCKKDEDEKENWELKQMKKTGNTIINYVNTHIYTVFTHNTPTHIHVVFSAAKWSLFD